MILDQLENKNLIKIKELEHFHNMAVCDYSAGSEAFKHHWEKGANLIQLLYNKLFPWNAQMEENKEKEYKDLSDQWKATFGDPDNPEYAAWLEKAARDTLLQAQALAEKNKHAAK